MTARVVVALILLSVPSSCQSRPKSPGCVTFYCPHGTTLLTPPRDCQWGLHLAGVAECSSAVCCTPSEKTVVYVTSRDSNPLTEPRSIAVFIAVAILAMCIGFTLGHHARNSALQQQQQQQQNRAGHPTTDPFDEASVSSEEDEPVAVVVVKDEANEDKGVNEEGEMAKDVAGSTGDQAPSGESKTPSTSSSSSMDGRQADGRQAEPVCPVCLDPLPPSLLTKETTILAPCGHVVCRKCRRFTPRRSKCPVCRRDVESRVRGVFA